MKHLQPHTTAVLFMTGLTCWTVLPSSSAEVTRDPFLFGSSGESVAPWSGVLIGILWDETSPLAMVGNETVSVGSELGPWKVVEIQQDGMVLQLGERREFVRIGDRLPSQ